MLSLTRGQGSGSRGRNRAARYHNALGSAREVVATFDVAVALGYVAPFEGRCCGGLIASAVRSCALRGLAEVKKGWRWCIAASPSLLRRGDGSFMEK